MGANIYLKIGGERPVGLEGMELVAFGRSSPYLYEFDAADAVVTWTDGEHESAPSEPYGATITA